LFCKVLIILKLEQRIKKGFFSHVAIPVKKGTAQMPSPAFLLYVAESLLLIGCSSAEPISSSTS